VRSSAEAIAQFEQADTIKAPPNPNFTQMISNRARQCGQHSGSLVIMLIRSSKPLKSLVLAPGSVANITCYNRRRGSVSVRLAPAPHTTPEHAEFVHAIVFPWNKGELGGRRVSYPGSQ
jgi:hypothetical protein